MDDIYAQLLADGLGGDVDIDPEDFKDGAYESTVPSEKRGNIVYNFVVAWNIILKKYATMLAARAGRRAKAKDQTTEDEPETPMEE
jgi:hypothetical protein